MKHLFLIDASSWIYRAFHALPPMTRPSDNLPVHAVFGFTKMLWELLHGDLFPGALAPTHVAAVFDHKGVPSFRTRIFAEYKANRTAAPDELRVQFPLCRRAVAAYGLPVLELPGYEADDLIATYTREAVEAGDEVTIVSSDKDLMQLLRYDGVTMFDTMKNRRIDRAAAEERWGVPVEMLIDLQALMGDTVDNVPGVPGIGEKTAAALLRQYGSLDALLYHVDDIPQPKRRASLIAHADNARLSRQLCTLIDAVPGLPLALADLPPLGRDYYPLIAFCKDMEFVSIVASVAAYMGVDPETVAAEVAA